MAKASQTTRRPSTAPKAQAPSVRAVETMARDHLIQPWASLESLGEPARTVVDKADGAMPRATA